MINSGKKIIKYMRIKSMVWVWGKEVRLKLKNISDFGIARYKIKGWYTFGIKEGVKTRVSKNIL